MTEDTKTILVVDDQADVRDFFSALLEDNGYRVLTAKDGKEALQQSRAATPDLILLDLMMPGQSGTDFYRHLVKDQQLAGIPIVVVSGTAGKHLAVKKPAAVLDKPVNEQELLDTVSGLLSTG